jgi:hypothetical protein
MLFLRAMNSAPAWLVILGVVAAHKASWKGKNPVIAI